ncbi:23S rRNA (guanosine(2251)-2'-O)-methyltransferase RlmB [Roseospirillum parvum]|uniref:23S rRNA (Guanosine2251-2'-O)-methyltransferase n=1 Tax=Roseospirillum parvum TaxID=83401 RepID=A0A1G8BDK3_9PROT|nr:23S rRNA (guanosine(2251)-2'-O)-methyltransferase RlmB [Roseospirillum parvum]SDH31258.1 23S rRNA (guanosine2251-2'-O)-methyltransferase [Roseospirillum parvum]
MASRPPPRRRPRPPEASSAAPAKPPRAPGPRRPTPPLDDGPNAVWLFGHHAVAAALANPARRCLALLTTVEAEANLRAEPLLADLDPARWPEVSRVERADLDRQLPPGTVHQGLALKVRPLPARALDEVAELAAAAEAARPGANLPVVVLDQVSDPRNLGAILRATAAFGGLAVIVQDRHSPGESGVLAKAASGTLETVPLIRAANLAQALEGLKKHGFWVAGLDARGPVALASAGLSGRLALVLGAEGAGLRRRVAETCDHLVKLPISPRVESLNVATAAAVALYELARETP